MTPPRSAHSAYSVYELLPKWLLGWSPAWLLVSLCLFLAATPSAFADTRDIQSRWVSAISADNVSVLRALLEESNAVDADGANENKNATYGRGGGRLILLFHFLVKTNFAYQYDPSKMFLHLEWRWESNTRERIPLGKEENVLRSSLPTRLYASLVRNPGASQLSETAGITLMCDAFIVRINLLSPEQLWLGYEQNKSLCKRYYLSGKTQRTKYT